MHDTPILTGQHNIWKPTAWASSSRRQVLPKDCVVDVASTIELQSRSQADNRANTICNNSNISVVLNCEMASNFWNLVENVNQNSEATHKDCKNIPLKQKSCYCCANTLSKNCWLAYISSGLKTSMGYLYT